VLLRPTASLADVAEKDAKILVVSVTRKSGEQIPIARRSDYTGQAFWIGCDDDVQVPQAIQDRGYIKSVRTNAKSSSIGKEIEEIRVAYTGDFGATFDRSQSMSLFPAWSGSSEFSRLLKMIGDFYDQQGDHKKALERYSLAAAIDIRNSEACLYAAAVLRDYVRRLIQTVRLLTS
jgi:hypothetical protein